MMKLPYSDSLPIGNLSRLFDNTSECYKYFWFYSIISKIHSGQTELTFNEIIDDMIVNAWYMVTEFHLNLGPRDALEDIVNKISEITGMSPLEKPEKLLQFIQRCDDKEILRLKKVLTYNVPYRLLSPFISDIKGSDWNCPVKHLVARLNSGSTNLYRFRNVQGLESVITISELWAEYIVTNYDIIRGWLLYKFILYLQRRNPSVPGISDKLFPPQERKLADIKKFWNVIIDIKPVREIYSNTILEKDDISIDHFIPWSFVAHDEFWNLNPTKKSINSSKSNNLPIWDMYFPRLCKQEFVLYNLIWTNETVRSRFDECAKEYLNNNEVRYRIYKDGLSFDNFSNALESIIKPVYESALTCGFKTWSYKESYDG